MKRAFFFIISFTIIILIFLLIKERNKKEIVLKKYITLKKTEIPSSQFMTTTLSEFDKNGKLIWKLNSKTLFLNRNKNEVILKNVKGTFFDKEIPSFDFSAGEILYNTGSKNLLIKDKVLAKSKLQKASLETLKLIFLSSSKKLLAIGNTEISLDNLKTKSNYLEADLSLKKIKLKGNIKTIIE